MIFIYYDKDSNVCVDTYEFLNDKLTRTHNEVVFNTNYGDKLFKEKLNEPTHFIDKVILEIQDRFTGQDVYIFNSEIEVDLYDRPELVNILFIYRREVHIFNLKVTEEDIQEFASWLAEHK